MEVGQLEQMHQLEQITQLFMEDYIMDQKQLEKQIRQLQILIKQLQQHQQE